MKFSERSFSEKRGPSEICSWVTAIWCSKQFPLILPQLSCPYQFLSPKIFVVDSNTECICVLYCTTVGKTLAKWIFRLVAGIPINLPTFIHILSLSGPCWWIRSASYMVKGLSYGCVQGFKVVEGVLDVLSSVSVCAWQHLHPLHKNLQGANCLPGDCTTFNILSGWCSPLPSHQ